MRTDRRLYNYMTLLLFSFFYSFSPVWALTPPLSGGTIKGSVTTNDGQPAADVMVQVKGTKRWTQTDDEGRFILHNMAAGDYIVEVSLVGYETREQSVTVTEKQTAIVNLQLQLSQKQLRDVVVMSGKNKFTRTQTEGVAKIPLKNIENPQVYSTVTKELIQEQVVTDLNGALKNVPGVTLLLQGDNNGGAFASRGFMTQSFLRNGIAAYNTSTVDPANLEKIEAIKGPSAALFGSSLTSYGGLFNRVTKKPFDLFKSEVGFTVGGFGQSRLTADINAPLNQDKTALFRVNIAKDNEGSFQDAGFSHTLFVAPGISYQVNDRLSFSIEAEVYQQKSSAQYRFFPEAGTTITTPQQLQVDYKRSFTNNDLTAHDPSTAIYAQMNYKLSEHWKSTTSMSYTSTAGNGIWAWSSVLPGDSSVVRNEEWDQTAYSGFDIQQNFTGDFYTGSIRHRVVGGLDVFGLESNTSYAFMPFDTVKINGPDPEYNQLNKTNLDAALTGSPRSHDISRQYTYAAYASDVINITDNLIAMLSLRIDHFVNKGDWDIVADATSGAYNQTALSPKFGLVYQVLKDKVALFGNYMNGFTNETGTDHDHNTFKPEQANQWEGGLKLNLLDGKLTGTFSYYDIKVKDVLRTDPDFPNFSIQNGTQYSKGIEAEVVANPFAGFNIVAGYAHNDSKYEHIDAVFDGHRPSSAGPADVANLWLSYRLVSGVVKGLGLGFGGNAAGKNNIVDESDGYFTLPAYTVLNASLFYDQPKYRLALKMDNITDKQYWVGWYTIIPQMPRRLSASVAIRF